MIKCNGSRHLFSKEILNTERIGLWTVIHRIKNGLITILLKFDGHYNSMKGVQISGRQNRWHFTDEHKNQIKKIT